MDKKWKLLENKFSKRYKGFKCFFSTASVDAGNLINTYLSFKNAGKGNDWCYSRQIGANKSQKLALDFHDDEVDARFCVRSIQLTSVNDVVDELKVMLFV